ncbi:nuclear protein 96-domain-containing protein [Hypoxylon trugodes]|uniref:nuclear protein 96-domain-containing protein n=1 Tax=Hypoxylon trugodes TaxID=326681 RepID=UPI0021A08F3D|nr:nuclear protein 96-domain-containing protein [Hypoxylon trugodes]KAI1387760.1 nuclear protein 96-domain-containing protein [Hypoxylon trugodes]
MSGFGGFGGSGSGFGGNNNSTSTGFGGFGASNTANTGFGANNSNTGGFGTPNNTAGGGGGSGLFGSGNTSSGFGGNTGGAFGSTSNTGAFGAKPTFGGTATSTGSGLFGGSTTSTTGGGGGFGGFGAGNNASTSTPFGGSTGGSIFGNSANNKPAFGATNTGTSGSGLFGGNATNNTNTSTGFGAFGGTSNTPASTALGGPVGDPPGTANITSFSPFVEKENNTSSAQNSYQNILFQDPYKKWSAEELRLADYVAGRRFGGTSGTGTFGVGSGFGGFGNQQTSNAFGSTSTPTNTAGTGGLFGGTGTSSTFGQNNTNTAGFGANNNSGGLFGSKPATTGGLFNSTPTTQPAQTGGLFGSGSTGFGNTGNTGTGFGATNNNTNTGSGLFGGANNQQKSGFSFGNTNNNATSGGFGNNTGGGAFGTGGNTGGGLFGGNNTAQNAGNSGGGLFANTNQQNTGGSFGGSTGGAFGNQNQQQTGTSLFGNNQQKPAGTSLFGASNNTGGTSGGIFANSTTANNSFGQPNNNQGGGLFGNKPATGTGTGLFANAATPQNTNTGGGLFGGLGQNNQNQQQPQQGSSLFGGLGGQNQQKPSLFGSTTQQTGGGIFGNQNNQQGSSLFGVPGAQQQPQNNMNSSLFGNSQASQGAPSLTASINDPNAYGSLFSNLGSSEIADPGPLATPTGRKQARKPSILPYYKLNASSAPRFVTPQKRGYGFSYSTYGTPNSPSSVASTPGTMSQSLLGGSLSRSLGNSLAKSVSTSNLRRNFNIEDSILAPGAFSASSGSRLYGNNSVKKLVINRDLRSDLFSTPTKDKPTPETPNSSRKLTKRVSFDTSNVDATEDSEAVNGSATSTPSAEQLGYIRPKNTNGVNGSKSSAAPEMEQVKGNELAVVHEEETASPQTQSPATAAGDGEPGNYWMSPTKEEIQEMNRVQRQKVSGFTVGRDNVGYVKFKVPVDLNLVDIDNIFHSIVILEPRTATVYPNAAKKPPVGKGLNVPAIINLENSWPRASRKGKPTSLTKHIERLKRIPDTKLENYNAETGEWTFSVEHFTTYGLDESDEEEDAEPRPSEAVLIYAPNRTVSPTSSVSAEDAGSESSIVYDGRRSRPAPPGAFDAEDDFYANEEPEMAEVTQSRQSFLADRSVGSTSQALIPMDQEEMDDEYEMSETQEDASASPGHHLAAEQDDNSFDGSQFDAVQETPAGIMRARMRAIKGSATPMKVQVSSGDDWMDMLSKTISPQKRDRALLRTINEADRHRTVSEVAQEASPLKKRIVPDGRGFATSIDLMNSLFEKAKAPAETFQASVRPKGVKWPYKRQTKHLDESNMDDKDRIWHDTMRPTWGPNGTLVFSATPSSTAFGRSGRITEKNGLMTVLKGGIVSESQDVRIAKFTNEMSARAIDAHTKLTQVQLIDGVPAIRLHPKTSLKDFAVGGNAKNTAEEHERLVWELASVLFDNVKIPADLQNNTDASEKLRREGLSRFWERTVEDQTSRMAAMAGSSEEKALVSLSGHRVAEACKHLLDGKNFRLATLISLIGTNDAVKKDIKEQMKEWQEANVLSEFSRPIRALYEMLSGNVCACEGTKGALENRTESFLISKKFGLNWQQAFGLRLWYAISTEDSIADAVEKYREDVEQDRELPPTTWFIEQGIKSIWNDPDQEQRQDLLWGLLCLYSDNQVDLEAILRPENSQLSPLDYRLSWQLGQALTSTGRVSFGKNAIEKADAATVSFAAQLINEGSWLEAIFVLLHLSDPDARSKAIQDHLCRHAGLIGNEESSSFRKLVTDYNVPKQWIWHSKALFMRSVKKDSAAEVQCLLRAESWADAHRTFTKEVAPITIIEREYDALADLLQQFEGHHSQVPDWNVGGEIYKAFLQLMGCQRRSEHPPSILVNALLEGLPAMHGNAPEAGIKEYAALTDMAAEVAKVVTNMATKGEMEHERILHLPMTEDVLLKHSRDLAWSHYSTVIAS